MSFFEYLLRLTSWPMTPPVLYGPFHLIAAFGGSAIAILAAWRFSSINNCNTNNRDNRRSFDQIMLVSGVILLIGELYKQLMNFYIVNNHAYDWWIFPFQLCSLPLYLCPLLILIHNEKRHRILCTFLLDFNMMGAVATFIDPSGIFHPYWTLTLHGVLWHLMLIFVGFVIIFSRKADLRFFLSGSRSPKQHPASFQCRQPILYLSLGNVHAATLWRYRPNSWPSCRNYPVHSGDDCRRLADSQHCQKNHSCREHLCTPSACPSLRSVILTLTIQFPSFASGKCQLSSQQRSKARMPV